MKEPKKDPRDPNRTNEEDPQGQTTQKPNPQGGQQQPNTQARQNNPQGGQKQNNPQGGQQRPQNAPRPTDTDEEDEDMDKRRPA